MRSDAPEKREVRDVKKYRQRGFSLVEMCIVLVVLSFVALLSLSLMDVSVHGFNASAQLLDVSMEDADFVARISSAVRKSGTSFTIPEKSFTVDKFTAGWNYLGVMHNVHIPANVSRTGREIASADALVYVEYAGDTDPSPVSSDAELIHTEDGYFIRHIIGHSYTDYSGVQHDYSLVFRPTDPSARTAQTISYTLTSTNGTADTTEVDTILEALNAIQVVYQGSETNPAVAIAFRSDFLPVTSVNKVTSNKAKGTVVLILDVSSSMNNYSGSEPRITTLKSTAKSFIEELSKNSELNILITVFSGFANKASDFDRKKCPSPKLTLANASADRSVLLKTIDAINTSKYTNLGDGLRAAYYELERHPEILSDPVFLLVLTDGEVNACTCVKKKNSFYGVSYSQADFYYGSEIYQDSKFENKYVCNYQSNATLARLYYQYFGALINEKYHPQTYLVSMYAGMSAADENALRSVFTQTEKFDASTLTQFTEVFQQINQNISSAMWAFEGPRL